MATNGRRRRADTLGYGIPAALGSEKRGRVSAATDKPGQTNKSQERVGQNGDLRRLQPMEAENTPKTSKRSA